MLSSIPDTKQDLKLQGQDSVIRAIEDVLLNHHKQCNPFYIVDLGEVTQLYEEWMRLVPDITPHYAVKCNNDPHIVQRLAELGAGFDCATFSELHQVMQLGVSPERVIFANPCKLTHHIEYARAVGVAKMTFDSMEELEKIHDVYPVGSQLILRIATADGLAQHSLSSKFGAELSEVGALLNRAKQLNLEVVGVSFHVGSSCGNPAAYELAIRDSRRVFDTARSMGGFPNFKLLDLGGGIPGRTEPTGTNLLEITQVIKQSLARYFPDHTNLKVVAEPGRYFAHSALTLVAKIYSRRIHGATPDSVARHMYYMNDGIYGSFLDVKFGYDKPLARILRPKLLGKANVVQSIDFCPNTTAQTLHPSCVWGPTCDSYDLVIADQPLPVLERGDWLQFDNMGAYSVTLATDFNGCDKPDRYYIN